MQARVGVLEDLLDVSARVVRNAVYSLGAGSGLIRVEPRDIEHVQSPEWRFSLDHRRRYRRPSTYIVPGDWDRVAEDRSLYFGGRYESRLADGERRVVPMERYAFYLALRERFLDGRSWENTEWVRWLRSRRAEGRPVSRYTSPRTLAARLRWLDRLAEDIARNGYASQRALYFRRTSWLPKYAFRRIFGRPFEELEPFINIGRGNRLILEDGRHRVCVAKVLGVRDIHVRVFVTHADVVKSEARHGCWPRPGLHGSVGDRV